jgi:hypothetical protein
VQKIAKEGFTSIKDNIKINKTFGIPSLKDLINVENVVTVAKAALKGT